MGLLIPCAHTTWYAIWEAGIWTLSPKSNGLSDRVREILLPVTYMQNLKEKRTNEPKNGTNELLYKTERDRLREGAYG